jgi:hypothetical protein
MPTPSNINGLCSIYHGLIYPVYDVPVYVLLLVIAACLVVITVAYFLREIRKSAGFALLHLLCCLVLASVMLIASKYSWVGLLTFVVAALNAVNPLKNTARHSKQRQFGTAKGVRAGSGDMERIPRRRFAPRFRAHI